MTNKHYFLLITFCAFLSTFSFAQYSYSNDAPTSAVGPNGVIRCSSMEVDAVRRLNNPNLPSREAFEEWLAPKVEEVKKEMEKTALKTVSVLQIPVVVHVLHNGEAIGTAPNITDLQIESQITALNNDFRRVAGTYGFNNDPVGADVEIEFVLARSDENGFATNGINRRNINQDGATRDDIEGTIKPATIWDPTMFLNMWTVKFAAPDDNLLGYAQFPGGSGLQGMPSGPDTENPETDGVVMRYNSFGSYDLNNDGIDDGNNFLLDAPYDLGRTATHEVGHWVGLRHIWGDGVGCNTSGIPNGSMCSCNEDDSCADTPNSEKANYSCDGTELSSCTTPPTVDMVENYMDYTNDNCMNIFTLDQKARMHAVMTNSPRRMELPTSPALLEPAPRVSFEDEVSSIMEGSSCNTKDIEVTLSIGQAPAGNATITLTASGTASSSDYTLGSTTVVFPNGSTADQTVTITISEDAEIETNETIILTITNASGGGSSIAPFNQTHTLTIADDDVSPEKAGRQPGVTIFNETFSDPLSSGDNIWTTTTSPSSPINWVQGNAALGIMQSAYVAQTALANTHKYDGMTEAFCRLESPTIDASEASNLVLSFDYVCMGETGFDFGSLLYSIDDGTTWRPIGGQYSDQAMSTLSTLNLPVETTGCATLKIAFLWSNDALVELNPPFNVDNVKIEADVNTFTEVHNSVNTATEQYLGPNQTVYFYDSATDEIMISVTEKSGYDYGCTSVEIDRSRASAEVNTVAFWNNVSANELVAQSFRIIPENNAPPANAEYDVTFYFRNNEIQTWEIATGQSRTNLKTIKVKDNPISAVNANNYGNFTIDVSDATIGQYNTSRITVTNTFSGGFSGFGVGIPGTPSALPIELVEFTGKKQQKDIQLKWMTESEINNDFFTLERSADGKTFEPLAEISGAGFSNELLTYDYLDIRPLKGKNYYRLRQTDFDGTTSLSNIIVFEMDELHSTAQVFPNPVSDELTVGIQSEIDVENTINLLDLNGRIIKQRFNNGAGNVTINVQNLVPGIYYIEIVNDNNRLIEKIVVE